MALLILSLMVSRFSSAFFAYGRFSSKSSVASQYTEGYVFGCWVPLLSRRFQNCFTIVTIITIFKYDIFVLLVLSLPQQICFFCEYVPKYVPPRKRLVPFALRLNFVVAVFRVCDLFLWRFHTNHTSMISNIVFYATDHFVNVLLFLAWTILSPVWARSKDSFLLL